MSQSAPTNGFDRVRPRAGRQRVGSQEADRWRDPQGRAALYSETAAHGAPLSAQVSCSQCSAVTVVTVLQLVRLAVPGLHLPFVRRRHGSWMRCPACRRRTWVGVRVRL